MNNITILNFRNLIFVTHYQRPHDVCVSIPEEMILRISVYYDRPSRWMFIQLIVLQKFGKSDIWDRSFDFDQGIIVAD
jgi:hypothetical protein